ncbi:hypothetical protein LINGRAHAP2_LOCUS23850 [Linum grandiflorum]
MPCIKNDSSGVEPSASPFVINRPDGRDKQKRKKRGTPDGRDACMEAWQKTMSDMVTNSNTHTRLALAREEREKAREARAKRKEDERYLNMDLSQYDPQTRAWYEAQKDAILTSTRVDPNSTPRGSNSNPWDDTYSPQM